MVLEIVDSFEGTRNDYWNLYDSTNRQGGQTFTASKSYTLCKVGLNIKKTGIPPNDLQIFIYSVSGGVPNTLLATFSNIESTNVSTSYDWITSTGTLSLTSGTTYAIVIGMIGGDSSNCYNYARVSSGGYSGGTDLYKSGSWTAYTGDNLFRTYRDLSLTTDLEAYYKFDGDATDSVGSNDGTVYGPTNGSSYGKINEGYKFDASSEKIDFGTATELGQVGDFSIGGWFYSTTNSQSGFLFARLSSGFVANPYQVYIGGTTLSLYLGNGSTQQTVTFSGAKALPLNTWTHIILTGEGTTMKLYYDGTLEDTKTMTAITPVSSSGRNFYIGSNNNNYAALGYFDEWAIWSRALSTVEVGQIYNGGDGTQYPFTDAPDSKVIDCVAYYKFDGDLTDSVNSYDLTNSGTTDTVSGKINNGRNYVESAGDRYIYDSGTDTETVYKVGEQTINLWIKIDTLNNHHSFFKLYNTANSRDWIEMIYISAGASGSIYFSSKFNNVNGWTTGASSATVSDNNFHMYTATSDGTYIKLYMDGTLKETITDSRWVDSFTTTINKVAYGSRGNNYYELDGVLDEVGVWHRALSSTEVSELYASGSPGSEQQYPFEAASTGWTGEIYGFIPGKVYGKAKADIAKIGKVE